MTEEIKGLKELLEKFDRHPAVMQREGLVKGMKVGAELVRSTAAHKAPRLTGKLADSMTVKVEQGGVAEVRALIGPGKDAFYGRYVEFGTKYQPARPFLRPALDEKQGEATQAIIDAINDVIKSESI